MAELLERYVHQVGRYLPPKERAEIEAELRSQIQDQVDDRYGASPSQAEVAAVLAEFGHPYQMAVSYSGEKYLVGPLLYPYMMLVLRQGWLIVPAIVIFLNIFGALTSSQPPALASLVIETLFAALQAALIFSAVVVLFFALIQHSYLKIDAKAQSFDPLDLPEVDDPGAVDRFEAIFGGAFGTLVILALIYFLRVGGLTLSFNLSDPGEVLPVPLAWLALMIIIASAMIILHLLVLRRNSWNAALWLLQTLLEIVGVICLYFVLYLPIFDRIVASTPALADTPLIGSAPEILVVLSAVSTLVRRTPRLLRLWNRHAGSTSAFIIQTDQ